MTGPQRSSRTSFSTCSRCRGHLLHSPIRRRVSFAEFLNAVVNENELIVVSPEQALDCFFRTAMDAVVIENTLVQRQPVETTASGDAATT
jgi:hypothetical protein